MPLIDLRDDVWHADERGACVQCVTNLCPVCEPEGIPCVCAAAVNRTRLQAMLMTLLIRIFKGIVCPGCQRAYERRCPACHKGLCGCGAGPQPFGCPGGLGCDGPAGSRMRASADERARYLDAICDLIGNRWARSLAIDARAGAESSVSSATSWSAPAV